MLKIPMSVKIITPDTFSFKDVWTHRQCLDYLRSKYDCVMMDEHLEHRLKNDMVFFQNIHGFQFFYKLQHNSLRIYDWKTVLGGLELFEPSGLEELLIDMRVFNDKFILNSQVKELMTKIDLTKNIIFDFQDVKCMTSGFISTLVHLLYNLKGDKIKNYKFINLAEDILENKIEDAYRMCFDVVYRDKTLKIYNEFDI